MVMVPTHLVPAKQRLLIACRPTSKLIGIVLVLTNDAARRRPDIPRQFIVPNVYVVFGYLYAFSFARLRIRSMIQAPGHFRLAAPRPRVSRRQQGVSSTRRPDAHNR